MAANKKDLRQVAVKPMPKSPGPNIVTYDKREMKVGAGMKKCPMPKEGVVKG